MEPDSLTSGNCAVISKMVSTYMKSSAPADAALLNVDNANHETCVMRQSQSDLIYNLSDVEKFLPKIEENANPDDSCGETFTRKRKERQDSGSFSVHECKVTRSNSEERTVDVKVLSEDNIRRVSSHEDFEKYKRPSTRAQPAPLHEQNHEGTHFPLRAHNRLETSSDNVYVKDINKSAIIGEKYSRFSVQDIDNKNSVEYYNARQKYSKNDNSPSRSSIHEYILFPKRISPNRDPNALGRDVWEMDSDAERARSSERRSRTRRIPTRRQPKQYILEDHGPYAASLKENDLMSKNCEDDRQNSTRRAQKFAKSIQKDKDASSSTAHNSPSSTISTERDKFKGRYERIYDENIVKPHHSQKENEHTKQLCLKSTVSKSESSKKLRERSQSPVVHSQSPLKKTPFIDLKLLHEQLGKDGPVPSVPTKYIDFPNDNESFENLYSFHDDSEPLLDDNIAGYSREISEIQNQKRILPDKCDYGSVEINLNIETDERLNKINKKIQTLKKKIAKSEIEFEVLHGYRASQADKMNDSALRKLYSEMRKLKYEKKNIKKCPGESLLRAMPMISTEEHSLKTKPIADIVMEIERRLEAKRGAHGRPSQLERCSNAQLLEEKAAVQRALLWLEAARGRPSSRPDRDLARPLYDRYRVLKRMVATADSNKMNSTNVGELATILENETLPSDSPEESPESADRESNSDVENKDSSSENKEIDEGASSSAKSTASDRPIIPLEEKKDIINENLHCLPLTELNKLLLEAKAMKLNLRSSIKAMEAEYDELSGRKILEGEKESIMQIYAKYKETKARVRLLSALVNKQRKM